MNIKTMSFNVLCYGPDEINLGYLDRKEHVINIIKREHPDTFGVQEAHYEWMKILSEGLEDYAYVGAGREDGKLEGEFSAVFYLKDKFELLEEETFWLSETPDVPSKGWDAKCIRVCSWAKLKDKETGKIFVHMNNHLDHIGPEARTKGLQMLLDKAADFEETVILTGDFNFDEGCDLYKQMTSGQLYDTKHAAEETMDCVTFTGFYPLLKRPNDPPATIDFINVTKGTKVKSYKVITDRPNGTFPSDHNPVVAEIEI